MKNRIRILLLIGMILFTAFSCDEENVDSGDFEPIEIKKITDFGCTDCTISLKPEYVIDSYYVIYSESDFMKKIKEENLPSIDFEKYFLIIGIKQFTTGATLQNEKAEENNNEIVYTVTFQKDFTSIPLALKYHAIIEKPIMEKEVRIEVVVNN